MQRHTRIRSLFTLSACAGIAVACAASLAMPPAAQAAEAAKAKAKSEFPDFEKVSKDFKKVESMSPAEAAKTPPMYTLYLNKKSNQLLCELPPGFDKQQLLMSNTLAGGAGYFTGLQQDNTLLQWKRYGKRLALIKPQLTVRNKKGDAGSLSSTKRVWTDSVVMDFPIVAMGPGGGPVFDLDAMLLANNGPWSKMRLNQRGRIPLAEITQAKAFPNNIEIQIELPIGGSLVSLHTSFSKLPNKTGYKPREADSRVGYFTTAYANLNMPGQFDPWTHYINRWDLQKADPSLAISPPKKPIVFYLSHEVPVRYRRWVREGVLSWNEAFGKIGFTNAIEVYQQDASSGAFMDKDPADVRWNFILWNTNGSTVAIGPSRVDPKTGQIYDADVVFNDGWVNYPVNQWNRLQLEDAPEDDDTEALGFEPSSAMQAMLNNGPRNPFEAAMSPELQEILEELPLAQNNSCSCRCCTNSRSKGLGLTLARLAPEMLLPALMNEAEDTPQSILDGVPESFIGPIIKGVICHEVGHTLGLRHNFVGSTQYTIEEINSEDFTGDISTSIMDYTPVNFNYGFEAQGPYTLATPGVYDEWAIACGYETDKKKLEEHVTRSSNELELEYSPDEDNPAYGGLDPRNRRHDLGADPFTFANSQMDLIQSIVARLTDDVVKDGESWNKAASVYQMLAGSYFRQAGIAYPWIGGSYTKRVNKGAAIGDDAILPVPAETQRKALQFVLDRVLAKDAFVTPPALQRKLRTINWIDESARGMGGPVTPSQTMQAAFQQLIALSQLFNFGRIHKIMDNELRVLENEDVLTLPEYLQTITDSVWSELDAPVAGPYSPAKPMIAANRRNLQRTYIAQMLRLTISPNPGYPSWQSASTIGTHLLGKLSEQIGKTLKKSKRLDIYTLAHLEDCKKRIDKALDAQYSAKSH